jgi:hypothetical protein
MHREAADPRARPHASHRIIAAGSSLVIPKIKERRHRGTHFVGTASTFHARYVYFLGIWSPKCNKSGKSE